MPINIGKNLKIQPTNDTKVSKFVRSYDKIYDYIDENYQDPTANITLYDLLTSMLETYTISYDNVPTGTTFTWKIGSTTLPQTTNVYGGQIVEYELLYSDDSKCVGSFTVDDDYVFDVSELEPNQFLVTITSDKTLSYLSVDRYYGTSQHSQYSVQSFINNTYSFYADKNEPIRLIPLCHDYTYSDKSLSNMGHVYDYTVSQNITCSAIFPYVAWRSYDIRLKDENDQVITNISQYWDDITVIGDSTKVEYKRDMYSTIFAIWTYPNTQFSYTININGYGQISDSASISNNTAVFKTLVPYCAYTLTPIPADSTVTLAASGYNTVSGVGAQTITVLKGTNVVWMIEKDDYETGSGTTTVTTNPQSETQEIEMRNFKVNIDDYEYTLEDGILKLTKYVGSGTTPTTPGLENI